MPTAQIFARAFEDSAPINGVWDDGEAMLGGWTVFIYDMGGQMMTDTFGNPIGTVYDGDGNRVRLGDGTLHTMTEAEVGDPARNPYGLAVGEVLVKGLAPGKYGMQIVPPAGQEWQQTATIEGTKGLDVWVKANEPRYFAEFGPAGHHAEFGFITTNPDLNSFPVAGDAEYAFGGSNTVSGRIVNLRMARPPEVNFSNGHPLLGCWVGLNNQAGTQGLTAVPCDGDSNFSISGLQNGSYQLVVWDKYLDQIIDTRSITVTGQSRPWRRRRVPLVRLASNITCSWTTTTTASGTRARGAYRTRPSTCAIAMAASTTPRRRIPTATCHSTRSSRSSAGWWRRSISPASRQPA